jgi:LysR family glycine cleavage system transcriptional activator
MGRQLPSLVALKAFEAAARLRSFTNAADELNVTQGAISRHVKSLEGQLGMELFRRMPRGLELTPEALAFYPVLQDAFDNIERATRRLVERPHERILTLSVLPTFAVTWLIPRLTDFNALHPNIEVHMITAITPADFRTSIDLAIRVGRPQSDMAGSDKARIELVMTHDWSGLASDFLLPDQLLPVCSPRLLKQAPMRNPGDLASVTLLHTATRPNAWADWLEAVGATNVDPVPGPAFGHFFMAVQAALRNRGVACVPGVLVAEDLANGRLVAPFPQSVDSAGGYHLLYRRRDEASPRIRTFRDWILSEARATNTSRANL